MTVDAKLRITPQLDAAIAALRGLRGEARALETGVQSADRAGTFSRTQTGLNTISGQLRSVHQQALAFLGLQQGAQAVAGLAAMSDQYTAMNARLRVATGGQEEFNRAATIARNLAVQYNAPLAETVALYTRAYSAVRPLGGGTREAAIATQAMLASLKISGATAAESASAILQYSQALGSGVLRGEEFNAINEAAPRLLDAVAAGMGKTRGELKGLAEQGQLTTSTILTALNRELPKLQQEAAKIPATISGAAQQVRDAFSQFVGQESAGAAQAITTLLQTIAANITAVANALQLLAVVIASVGIARGISSLVGFMGSAAAAGGVLVTVFSRIGAVLGGPVGVIALLGSLTAAFVEWSRASGRAQDAAAGRFESFKSSREQLTAIDREMRDIEDGYRRGEGGLAAKSRYQLLRETRQAIAPAAAEETRQDARRNFRRSETMDAEAQRPINLLDPASLKKFQDEYKLRGDIVKKYADERNTYVKAKDIEIAQAEQTGNVSLAKQLRTDKLAYLREQKRAESETLKAYDTRDAATRLAQARTLYDKDFELLADSTRRQREQVQQRFDAGLMDLQEYLREKNRLQVAESEQDIQRVEKQLNAELVARAINRQRLKAAKDANSRLEAADAVLQNTQRIAELETEIEVKRRNQLDQQRALAEEAQKFTTELRDQAKAIDAQIRQMIDRETPADIQRRIKDQMQPQLNREFQLGGDGSRTQQLIDMTVMREVLAQLEREYARTLNGIRAQEEAVRIQQQAGAIDVFEAERRVLEIRRASVLPLQEQLAEIERISSRLGADEQLRARQARNSLDELRDARTSAQRELTTQAQSGLATMFTDIVTGAKSAGEALRSMVAGFARQMLDLINQRLAARLFESFGLGKVVDGAASVITGFFHGGGVVGAGAPGRRSLDVSPLAVALAPRYHQGYTPQLRSGERLAVLEDSEEVLTASNPRHVRNFQGGAGGVSVSANIQVAGVDGGGDQQRRAGESVLQAMRQAIDGWAVEQSRPGGYLYRGA